MSQATYKRFTVRGISDKSECGEPGFVGKDVCDRLGYANHNDAIGKHCRGVAIRYPIPDALGRDQDTRILTEPDVLRLIVSSSLPDAQEFERWVFEEVLPSIRRTGQYVAPRATLTPVSFKAEAKLPAESGDYVEYMEEEKRIVRLIKTIA